jgi:hypothetical protein
MNDAKAFAVLLILLAGASKAAAATPDTISGTITDSATNSPLGAVTVSSEGFTTTSKADGTFSLVFATTGVVQGVQQDQVPMLQWNSATESFALSGYSGEISIRVRDLAGRVLNSFDSPSGAAPATFSMRGRPQGMYVAEVRSPSRVDEYRILNLNSSGSAHSTSTVLARSLATGMAHTLTFTMAGYTTLTLTVASGTRNAIAVKLSPVKSGAIISLFDGKTLNGWLQVPAGTFTVTDSSIAMTGKARGFLYLPTKYSFYRVIFSVRQVAGVNHWPTQLFFGTSTTADAMAGIQFQLPEDYGWDYRPGKNNSGAGVISSVGRVPNVTKGAWARCELLVNAATGTARGAAAQPIGTKAIEVLDFKDATVTKAPSYFAIQSHNAGQYDEYKNITIEVNPTVNDLITTK